MNQELNELTSNLYSIMAKSLLLVKCHNDKCNNEYKKWLGDEIYKQLKYKISLVKTTKDRKKLLNEVMNTVNYTNILPCQYKNCLENIKEVTVEIIRIFEIYKDIFKLKYPKDIIDSMKKINTAIKNNKINHSLDKDIMNLSIYMPTFSKQITELILKKVTSN